MNRPALYVGPVDPDLPLPMDYLAHAALTAAPHHTNRSDSCRRCDQTWLQHQWVLFGPNWQELDCSNRPRRGAE